MATILCDQCDLPATQVARDVAKFKNQYGGEDDRPVGPPRYGCDLHPPEPPRFRVPLVQGS